MPVSYTHLSLDYLFCRTENRAEINTPLRELHLSDEMVALLKSGRINNRLLCELATHKDFIKFLADIEMYVDGIATMQIQNLNALGDTVRHEIIERYRPGEDDPVSYTQLAVKGVIINPVLGAVVLSKGIVGLAGVKMCIRDRIMPDCTKVRIVFIISRIISFNPGNLILQFHFLFCKR